jgi:hypothetical protein
MTGSDEDAGLTAATPLLDDRHSDIAALIASRGWLGLDESGRIGAAYDFVRNEIAFGYNRADDIPASAVLADGYGQCNTKATLLMALLRALGIPCRLHGFTIRKSLQRGVVPELVYRMAPDDILHSWVEVLHRGEWLELEGFILDAPYLGRLQERFGADGNSLCAYGAGTANLADPQIAWRGRSTYIQKTGINRDLGLFDTPDAFYAAHRQTLPPWKERLYRFFIRHWMNWRVKGIRQGRIPAIPTGGEAAISEAKGRFQ